MSRYFQDSMRSTGTRVLRDDYSTWRGCARKVRHSTEDLAKRVRLTHPNSDELGVYFCEKCYGWHIGHKGGDR